MKTVILLIQLVLISNAFAKNTSSDDEYTCITGLKEQMDPHYFYAPENRGTLLFFFPAGQAGKLNENQNPALLMISRYNLQVCGLSSSYEGVTRFSVRDGAGPALNIAHNLGAAPHFRDLGFWSSAPARTCSNALSGVAEPHATETVKKIILQALKKYLTTAGAQASLPAQCKSAAGIKDYDIEMLRREVAGTSQPAAQQPSSNAEQP